MITELHKQPFARPLLIWIVGILLHTFFSYRLLVGAAIILPLLLLLSSYAAPQMVSYGGRWMWGVVFSLLLLAVSVLVSEQMEKRLVRPSAVGWLEQMALAGQQQIAASFDTLHLDDTEKSVLATLTVGYRKAMNKEINRRFSLTGVSHILSVSGFHVAVVCGFVLCLLSFLPPNDIGHWIKYPLAIALVWVYVYLTGLSIPSVRSGLMMSLYLGGNLLHRVGDRYNTLVASAFVMLVYNPFYLFDIGFQLSYSAVWFILFLQPRLQGLLSVRNPLLTVPWKWITVTLAAQIGTTFLCLYYFGQFSTVFLFTNLPLTAISTLLIPLGLLWALFPACMPGYGLLQSVVEFLTRSMVWVVDRFSAFPFASISFRFDFYEFLVGYAILFSLIFYCYKPRASFLISALALCLLWLIALLVF